jgi:hypothetical protein
MMRLLHHLRSGTVALAMACMVPPALAQAPSPPAQKLPPKKPPAATAPQAPAAPAPTDDSKHMLLGDWNIYWVADNRTSKMKVFQAQTLNGVTSFAGALATAYGEACTFSGNVLDTFTGQFADDQNIKTVNVSAYVIIKGLCDNGQVWIEAFGLPSGKALMSGRATFINMQGNRNYVPVALGR